MGKMIEEWTKPHNKELRNLCSSRDIIRMMGEARSKGDGYENAYKVLTGKPEGKTHLERLGEGGNVTLKWIC
jgi:hypothetical protein